MARQKRKFLAVTMKPELVERCMEHAVARDIPLTAWVRDVVEAELARLREAA